MNASHSELFRTITIHGLVATDDGQPATVVLDRKPSFPQPLYQGSQRYPLAEDISARPIVAKLDLEVRILMSPGSKDEGEMCGESDSDTPDSYTPPGVLGRGRAGRVYPLELLSICLACDDGANGETASHIPSVQDLPPLCIKIGTPTYARRLAREVWYYERFDKAGLAGVIVPRCYGVFCASLRQEDGSLLSISLPGYDYETQAAFAFQNRDVSTARLPEETERSEQENGCDPCPTVGSRYVDDVKGSHASSSWLGMRERRDEPVLTVLIMEKLGEMLTYEDYDNDKDDIDQLFDHLYAAKVNHGDERFRNILRAPDTAVVCPQHNKRHKWMMVDWEGARTTVKHEKQFNFLNRGRIELRMMGENPYMAQD